MKPNLLWDLDGTLTDPKDGIVRCFQYALEKSGHAVQAEDDLLWVIGPPLQESFSKLFPEANSDEIWKLVAKFRERYSELGMFENQIYPGIPEILSHLQNKALYVATSKAAFFARRILDHFELTSYFKNIYGAELDGTRSNKAELIQFILETEGLAAADTVIIGDRKHDVIGAKKTGISSIGITWGYGSRTELEEAGADFIFDEPAQLLKHLARLF